MKQEIQETIQILNELRYKTNFGRMFITVDEIKSCLNNEITDQQAEVILVKFYEDNWKYISDFSNKLFREFNGTSAKNHQGFSFFKLCDRNQSPQLYAVNLNNEKIVLESQTQGREIESVALLIDTIDEIEDYKKNVARKALTIHTAFRLLMMIMNNSASFSPTIGSMTLTPIYQSPIKIRVTLKDGQQITREIFTEEQIYIQPQGNYSIEDGLKFWSQFHPYVGLHYHISQYMELGTVEGISSYSFANEVEEFMNKFYDIPATETSESVTNFKIVDVKNGLFLCQCKDTGIFFIAEDFSTLISKYEDYILEELYVLSEDISIKDVTDEMLINMGFSLDMDFFTVERYDNIDNARKQVKELLK
jgi:hypothetical protein